MDRVLIGPDNEDEIEWGTGIQDPLNQMFEYIWSKIRSNNVFKPAAFLGNSLVDQESWLYGGMVIQGAQGVFNWANSMCGAPFHFECNLGVSGDTDENIFSRIGQIPAHIEAVFVMPGTNNAQGVPSNASAAQIDAHIASMIGPQGSWAIGLARLKAAGKKVCLCTIPPRNVGYVENDPRFRILDEVNAWAIASSSAGRCVATVDLHGAFLDTTQPTWRKFKTDYSSDDTHFTNKAGLAGGKIAMDAIKKMYVACSGISTKYNNRFNPIRALGVMRTLPNVVSANNAGTGPVASGWALSKNGVGAPVVTTSLVPYSIPLDYIGPNADQNLIGVDEKFQKIVVSPGTAANGTVLTFGLYTALNKTNGLGISPGDNYFVEADIIVENATGLKTVSIGGLCYFTAHTDAKLQPYSDTGWHCKTQSGLCQNGTVDRLLDANTSYKQRLITSPVRVPEVIDSTQTLILVLNVEMNFGATGGGTFYIGRGQIWRSTT